MFLIDKFIYLVMKMKVCQHLERNFQFIKNMNRNRNMMIFFKNLLHWRCTLEHYFVLLDSVTLKKKKYFTIIEKNHINLFYLLLAIHYPKVLSSLMHLCVSKTKEWMLFYTHRYLDWYINKIFVKGQLMMLKNTAKLPG